MSTVANLWESPQPGAALSVEQWFAVQTRARNERVVAQRLREKGLTAFLPVYTERRKWSDRWKQVEMPLFSCYVFVRLATTNENRLRVLMTDGVFDFVGTPRLGTPIPDSQIDSIQTILSENMSFEICPFLKIGQRVLIRTGALAGIEGVLVARSGSRSLVVTIDAIQRSLSVRVEGYELEAV